MNDKELIEKLGGVSSVARLTGFSVQRVQNWINPKRSGIPASVKLEFPEIFLRSSIKQSENV